MSRQKGSANFAGTIEVLAGGPLDARTVVGTVADLTTSATFDYTYEGMKVYVKATKKCYTLTGADPTISANWVVDGSDIEVDDEISSVSENPVQNKVIKTALDNKADLDNGRIPASQLPSYVDDVVEGYYNSTDGKFYKESTYETEIPGEAGKSYVDKAENKSYRWTGSAFTRVDEGVQLGETNATAYRGDRGKEAYDISQTVGDVDNLQTTEKGTIVGAINEARVFDNIANRPELPADLSNIIDELPNGATVKSCVPMNNKFNRADIYSTTEKIVGAWTDGKPLYQKTVEISALPSTANTPTNYAHGISNVDRIVKYEGMIYNSSGGPLTPFPWVNGSNMAQLAVITGINATNITIATNQDRSSYNAKITLQYTKTTDTAGSFNPSTETDYSTNETVVGTWIDGKPIYQKTYQLSTALSLTSNTWIETSIPIGDMDSVINCNAKNGITYSGDLLCGIDVGSNVRVLSTRTATHNINCITIQYTKTTD